MGIVNIGNDSVADSSSLSTLSEQVQFAMRQYEDGAHIVDIGVQSGRTDTPIISDDSEIDRLVPLVAELTQRDIPVSVDTWRPSVAKAAIDAGACLINDVSGLSDIRMADVAAETGAGLLIMHTRAKPKQEHFPDYRDLMGDVLDFLSTRMQKAINRGVDEDQLIVDPGPDFAKTPAQTIEVLRRLSELQSLNRPILLAVSRKYFIGMLTGKGPEDRLAGTLAAIGCGVSHGAHIVRVHDVSAASEFLALQAVLNSEQEPRFRGDPNEDSLKWLSPRRTY